MPAFFYEANLMRKILDGLYRFSAVLSAISMLLIATIVVVQVGFRIINSAYFSLTEDNLGLLFPSSAEFVGYLMVATSFLGLAYTLRKNGHIRVSILLNNVPPKLHRLFELACLSLGAAFTGFIVYHTVLFVYDSYVYDEVSYGIIAVPLFIPQLFMLFGVMVLFVAFLDDLLCHMRGEEMSYSLEAEAEIGSGGGE